MNLAPASSQTVSIITASAVVGVLLCTAIPNGNGLLPLANAQIIAPRTDGGNVQDPTQQSPYPRRIAAPAFDGAEWVNTDKPLSLSDFRGRFVLLDFWTYCCINCMHVLPELKKLEHAYPTELVVIGIHSAKFEGEQVTDNIRQAALRYEIEHPVVNDAQQRIWRQYGARAWPTLVLIDPEGYVVWAASGERTFDDIKTVIDFGLPYYRAQGLLRPAQRPVLATSTLTHEMPMKFPGKVLADDGGQRLFIADSNHNRIVVAGYDGNLQLVIGSGGIGRADGGYDSCSFNKPQGMALVDETLYIADTENHLIRKADLTTRQVSTVAGTGEKGAALFRTVRSSRAALASPWAVWPHEKFLYIAMAGPHQIWRIRLDETRIGAFAGNGREDIIDGPLLPRTPYELGFSSFAQPSGLTSDGKWLFVADSEGSAIRAVPFTPNGRVKTVVGLTGTLFDFGDVDGQGAAVRLQHPLGVTWWAGKLYVADTYNNKIKVVNPADQTCHTIAGTGKTGNADAVSGEQATFNEPAGICAGNGKLYVADTNNHVIRTVDLAPPYRVTTFAVDGLEAPK